MPREHIWFSVFRTMMEVNLELNASQLLPPTCLSSVEDFRGGEVYRF